MLVVRSLVPRGLAAVDGRLTPGDRLLSVNEVSLEHCSMSYALHMMHSVVDGCRVRLRVAKPMRPLAAASLTAAAASTATGTGTTTATATATAGAGASHESPSPSHASVPSRVAALGVAGANALVNAAATSAQLAGALERIANRSAASAPRGLLTSTSASLHLAASSGRDPETNSDRQSPNPPQMAVL